MITLASRTMAMRLKQIDEMLHATPSCVRARVLSPSAVNPRASRITQRGTTSRSRCATYHKVAPPTKVSTPRTNCMLNCTPDRRACGALEKQKAGRQHQPPSRMSIIKPTYCTVTVPTIPIARCGVQLKGYAPGLIPANETV